MDHDETGCQAAPEGPILCINNCGFFGSATTMNMCSKCHKDYTLNEDQAKLAASSIGNIMNGSSSSSIKGKEIDEIDVGNSLDVHTATIIPKIISVPSSDESVIVGSKEEKPKEGGPLRCMTCRKRVGLTGFKCRCGYMYCGTHRYSDKHECSFDYHTAGQDAITKANPVVKAEKLDKI